MRRLDLAPAPREPWTWTQRFVGASLLSLLLAAVQLNWFGLLPGTNADLITQAALLTLIGLFALRVSPVGIAIGLVIVYIAIFVDQATAGVGIVPLRFAPGAEFWTITLPRVCLTFMAFPLLIWALCRFAPPLAGGVVIGAALVALPFIRYDPTPSLLSALLSPGPGRFLVLAVPWLQLCGLVAVLASGVLLLRRARPRLITPAVAILAAITLVVPLISRATAELQASVDIAVSPSSGGPLTEIEVRAAFDDAGTPILTWDGERVMRDAFLSPLRAGRSTRANLRFLPASAASNVPGSHQVGIRMGTDARVAHFQLVSPGGLTIAVDADRMVLIHGSPLQSLRVLVDGEDGPQLLDVSFDGAGLWRSPLVLPAGEFRIVAQSGQAWGALDLP